MKWIYSFLRGRGYCNWFTYILCTFPSRFIIYSFPSKHQVPTPYLCISDGGDPERLGWAWHRQHAPQEHHEGEGQGEQAAVQDLVEDHQEVTDQLGPWHQRVIRGLQQEVYLVLVSLKLGGGFALNISVYCVSERQAHRCISYSLCALCMCKCWFSTMHLNVIFRKF